MKGNGCSTIVAAPIDSLWLAPPERLTMSGDVVHVWRARLDQSSPVIKHFEHTLPVDERLRADRFYFRQDRDRFIAARGILRTILGRYLDRAPQALTFIYGAYGKPSLALESDANPIRFNISHSHGTALYAVTRGREIGVDLEYVRNGLAIEEIVTSFFSRTEISALCSLSAELRRRAFFACWTRKEAYIKAMGEGLSLSLAQFDVSLIPGEPAVLLATRPDSKEALRWSLHELALGPDYVAAFVVEGRDCSLSCWQWPQLPLTGSFSVFGFAS
jgi:4'-phosphopantetheinyl transferase